MRYSRLALLTVLGTLALLLAPYVGTNTASASNYFGPGSYICAASANSCSNASLIGIDVDSVGNIVYAVDEVTNGTAYLVRIDGSTDTVIDYYTIPNCNDARRPAVAHVGADVKIYVGCEDQHAIAVIDVPGGGSNAFTQLPSISLVDNGITYETKTERVNPYTGVLYVVGDNPFTTGSCNDPAFAINTTTDTITATNDTLGTLNAESDCGYTGINDVAFSNTGHVYFANEDDHRLYMTDGNLNYLSSSNPLAAPCDTDFPQHVAVISGDNVAVDAQEAGGPCDTGNENGILATYARTSFLQSRTSPNVGVGPMISVVGALITTNRSGASGIANCMRSCIQVRSYYATVIESLPVDCPQNDIAYNPVSKKMYATLDQGCTLSDGVTNANIVVFQGRR